MKKFIQKHSMLILYGMQILWFGMSVFAGDHPLIVFTLGFFVSMSAMNHGELKGFKRGTGLFQDSMDVIKREADLLKKTRLEYERKIRENDK